MLLCHWRDAIKSPGATPPATPRAAERKMFGIALSIQALHPILMMSWLENGAGSSS
jgi:hypothetical protein